MKDLVEAIAKALVDHPEQVQVRAVEGEQVTVLELRVHPEDLGKVIGRQGRTAERPALERVNDPRERAARQRHPVKRNLCWRDRVG